MKMMIFITMILFSMGFYLLLERKILALMNFRLGPTKVMFLGMTQFIMDSMKLIFKNFFVYSYSTYVLYMYMFLLLNMSFWMMFTLSFYMMLFKFSIIIFILILMIKLFIFCLLVFNMDSNYGFMGLIRCLVQLITYDVLIIVSMFMQIIIFNMITIFSLIKMQTIMSMFMMSFIYFFVWMISMMMELSRLPFDFYESESELVSGFNIEYGSLVFMIIFMVEYLDIMYLIFLTVTLFLFNKFIYFFMITFLVLMYLIRGYLTRMRYDHLIVLGWMKLMMIQFLHIFLMSSIIFMI